MKIIRILIPPFIVMTILGMQAETTTADPVVYPYSPAEVTIYTRTVQLRWQVASAQEFHVQVSRESDFDPTILDVTLSNDESLGGITFHCSTDGVYYWRVNGFYTWRDLGWLGWEETYFVVDTSLPPTPVPASPSYSDIVLAFSDRTQTWVNFRWSYTGGQIGYWVQVSKRRDFSTIIAEKKEEDGPAWAYSDNEQTVFIRDAEPGECYWRVKVQRESGWSEWSNPVNFWLFYKVKLNDPPHNCVLRTLRALLKWDPLPVSPISQYEVQWSMARDFSTAVSQITSNTYINTPSLQNNTDYYWRVKHQGAPWTGEEYVRKFTVRIIPMMPEMVQPSHSIKILTPKPTFKWEHTPYAASYRLEVRKDGSTGRLIFQKSRPAPRIRRVGGTTIVMLDSPVTLGGGKYCCLIQACNSSGECSGWGVVEFGVADMKKPHHIPKVPKDKLPKQELPDGRDPHQPPVR
jgi:hypothetical protein